MKIKNKLFNHRLNDKSNQQKLRDKWDKNGYELIDITLLTELKQGQHGCCNSFNEHNQNIYHIQVWYRDDVVANAGALGMEIIDEDKYLLYSDASDPQDYIIFRKVKK